jgi:hypothetical protein
MPALATIKHAPQWVSYGPPNTDGGASDWCRLSTGTRDSWYQDHAAPGGIILCKRDTTELHPEAKRYARQAWATYGHYLAALHPELVEDWTPQPVDTDRGIFNVKKPVWDHRPNSPRRDPIAPGGWVLCTKADEISDRLISSYLADHYAELEWARFAKLHVGQTRTDNTKLTGNAWQRPSFLNPQPVLTEANVRNANKYTRRGITTAADRAASEKNIKRPVVAGAA